MVVWSQKDPGGDASAESEGSEQSYERSGQRKK